MNSVRKDLIKGSAILLICFMVFHILNFAFHFFMARALTIGEYGTLASLFSVVYIFSVFPESIQLIITKYTSKEKNPEKLKNIFRRSTKKAIMVSSILFVLYSLASIFLSEILNIPYPLLFLNGFLIFFIFLTPITRGLMQGKKRFWALGTNVIIESAGKLVISLFLVYLGLRVYGAVLGLLAGIVLAFVFSFFSIRDVLAAKERHSSTEGIYKYSQQTFIITFVLTVFYSMDIILAKAFFSEEIGGAYALASILAKAIFWGTQPVSKAMFPLSVESYKNQKQSFSILYSSLSIIGAMIFIALGIFYLFPTFVISAFSGKSIPNASAILLYVGAGTSILSFANIVLLHHLSLSKIRAAPSRVVITAVLLLSGLLSLGGGYLYFHLHWIIFLGIILLFINFVFFLVYLAKGYDLGWLFFIVLEVGVLSVFNNNERMFSIAFALASSALLLGTIIYYKRRIR